MRSLHCGGEPVVEQHGRVLVIDADQDLVDIVYAVLTDAGFTVSVLTDVRSESIRVMVGQFEPDCVLLDAGNRASYGESWMDAAWLAGRSRPVPVIMVTTDQQAIREVGEATSARSQLAAFDAVLAKPFDIDELVDAVARAVGHAVPFDTSPAAEVLRTQGLKEKLEAAGAREVHTSSRREWANFRTQGDTLVQLYWWQRDGVYYVLRHAESGGRLEQVGRFHDLDAAIALGMRVRSQAD